MTRPKLRSEPGEFASSRLKVSWVDCAITTVDKTTSYPACFIRCKREGRGFFWAVSGPNGAVAKRFGHAGNDIRQAGASPQRRHAPPRLRAETGSDERGDGRLLRRAVSRLRFWLFELHAGT